MVMVILFPVGGNLPKELLESWLAKLLMPLLPHLRQRPCLHCIMAVVIDVIACPDKKRRLQPANGFQSRKSKRFILSLIGSCQVTSPYLRFWISLTKLPMMKRHIVHPSDHDETHLVDTGRLLKRRERPDWTPLGIRLIGTVNRPIKIPRCRFQSRDLDLHDKIVRSLRLEPGCLPGLLEIFRRTDLKTRDPGVA